MQPLFELTLMRPWHWGIAILAIPGGEFPELDGQPVTVGDEAVVLGVVHAQDTDEDERWAIATVHVRSLVEAEHLTRQVLADVVFTTPDEQLSLGDADGWVELPCPAASTRVLISVDQADPEGLGVVWIDLIPAS